MHPHPHPLSHTFNTPPHPTSKPGPSYELHWESSILQSLPRMPNQWLPSPSLHMHELPHMYSGAYTHTHARTHTDNKPPIYEAVTTSVSPTTMRPETEDPAAAVTANQANPSYIPLEQLMMSQTMQQEDRLWSSRDNTYAQCTTIIEG